MAFLSTAELAQRVGCTKRTIHRYRAQGLITPVHQGTADLYDEADVPAICELYKSRVAVRPGRRGHVASDAGEAASTESKQSPDAEAA